MSLDNIEAQIPEGITVSPEDAELLKFIENSKPKIYVVGAGGSGCNTMSRMHEMKIEGIKSVAMNTDVQHLVKMRADKKILLGKKTTKGMGAGSNPAVGEAAAKESAEEIKASIADAMMVFITCGLGGGTGTGSAHVIAEQAKASGALTIAVVTLPFASEGKIRLQNALEGLDKLRKHADTADLGDAVASKNAAQTAKAAADLAGQVKSPQSTAEFRQRLDESLKEVRKQQ